MKRKKIVILPRLDNRGGDPAKKWQVMYWVRDPRTDKMVRFRVNQGLSKNVDFDTKTKIAENLIKEITAKLESGWNPLTETKLVIYEDQLRYRHVTQIYKNARASNNTARFLASEYLNSIEFEKSEATICTYRSKLRIFCDWLDYNGHADNDITTISNDHLIDFFNFMIQERKLSGNTIKKFKNTLHLFFEFVCKAKHTRINPCFALPITNRINDQAPRPILEEDMQKLKRVISVEDPQLWMAIEFQYYCALRPGKELRLLRVFDIDFTGGYAYVSAQRAKNRTKRAVRIPDVFLEILKNKYMLHKAEKSDFVFSKNGAPGRQQLGKNNMRYRFNRFRDDLGLSQEYKFYSSKHTGALKLLRAGFSIDDIANHLGHTSKSSTEHYIKSKLGWETERIAKDYPEI